MADTIAKIVGLEYEINAEIDRLVETKKDIVFIIKQVENLELQTLLEIRYLCFKTWEQIAVDLGYELRYTHKLHGKALDVCSRFLKEDTKRHYYIMRYL